MMNKLNLIWLLGVFVAGSVDAASPSKAEVKAAAAICAACHGQNGHALVPSYPHIAGLHSRYAAKQLREYKAAMMGQQGRKDAVMGGMVMALTPEMMDALSHYYAEMPAKVGEAAPESAIKIAKPLYSGGDAERKIAACSSCHGPTGKGAELAGFSNLSGQSVEYLKLQLNKFRSGERSNDINATMRDAAKQLTDEEIDALAKYISGLK